MRKLDVVSTSSSIDAAVAAQDSDATVDEEITGEGTSDWENSDLGSVKFSQIYEIANLGWKHLNSFD